MDMERAPAPKGPVPPAVAELNLPPGFRFHPTDEELMVHYLSRKATPSHPYGAPIAIIAEVDLYKFDPWELPQQASFGEKEWYFFSPRERKYPNGARPNRAAASGYWKATGTDKPICSSIDGHKVGVKKALVFYKGRAPRGIKTNWIMHEYRLIDSPHKPRRKGSRLDDWVLCRIYKKKTKSHRSGNSKAEGAAKRGAASTVQATVNEDVLASLPDIDNSKISTLPRLGSLNDAFVQNLLAADPARAPTSNHNNNTLGQFGTLDMMDRERVFTSSMLGQAPQRNTEPVLLLQPFSGNGLQNHDSIQQQMSVLHEVPSKPAHNFFSDNTSSNSGGGGNKGPLSFTSQFSSPQYSPSFVDYSNSFQFFSS